jgi:glutathione synthase/RimK-type ligase-like ATP-grasp enzyme
MNRIAPHNEWRANIHLGAKVDLIFRRDGPYVLEGNASPGFRGPVEATGVNAADAIVECAVGTANHAETALTRGVVPAAHG